MEDKLQTLMQSKDEMIIYQTEDGTIKLDVLFDNDTVWLSADQMGQLFGKSKSTISEHLKNVFEEGELQRDSVVRNFRTTASDGKNYDVVYYNLDVIISVAPHKGNSYDGTLTDMVH